MTGHRIILGRTFADCNPKTVNAMRLLVRDYADHDRTSIYSQLERLARCVDQAIAWGACVSICMLLLGFAIGFWVGKS